MKIHRFGNIVKTLIPGAMLWLGLAVQPATADTNIEDYVGTYTGTLYLAQYAPQALIPDMTKPMGTITITVTDHYESIAVDPTFPSITTDGYESTCDIHVNNPSQVAGSYPGLALMTPAPSSIPGMNCSFYPTPWLVGFGFSTDQLPSGAMAGWAMYNPNVNDWGQWATPMQTWTLYAFNASKSTAGKIAQTITFTSTAPANATVGGTYTVAATASSGLAVTFSIDSASTAGACKISGSAVSFTGAGTCIVDANQADNTTYAAAPQVQQTITISAPSSQPITPQAATGDWYDPAYNGSGFNITLTPAGLILYYYGWDANGNPLWLVSDIGPTAITAGTEFTVNLNQTSGGHFLTPANPSTASHWGTLAMKFSADGATGTATLTGNDGKVSLALQKIVGMTSTPAATGDWYDPAYNGSGFNMIVTGAGLSLYYYGWDASGNRLWLVSDLGPTKITPGSTITLNMNRTSGGHFLTPANPASTASVWGTLKLNFSSCSAATATLTGNNGSTVVLNHLQMIVGVMNAPPGC
jgi:hypothetical protein